MNKLYHIASLAEGIGMVVISFIAIFVALGVFNFVTKNKVLSGAEDEKEFHFGHYILFIFILIIVFGFLASL
jgi:hypothetical protein